MSRKISRKIGLLFLSFITSLTVGCSSSPSSSDDSSSGNASSYYTQLGVAYLQKNRLDLANINLEKAIAQTPGSADTQHYYALLQERLGNNSKAQEHFRRALQIDRKNPELLNNYGSFLCKIGDVTGAEKSFLSAVSDPLYKTPEFAYTNAGICVGKRGDSAAAEGYFRQALQTDGQFSEALYQMAKLKHEKGDNPKAQAFLYRYNETAPATADALLLCYRIEAAMNEPDKAASCAVALRGRFPESAAASQIN
jgi:type IV pilus assembly protein PilF